MAGGFFGGLAEGIEGANQQRMQQQQIDQNYDLGQRRLQLQQQQVNNEQQRALFARADKDVSNLMETASHTIETLKLQGKDNASIAKAIQPLVQAAKRLKQGSGGDPSMIDAQVAATLAQPGFNPQTGTTAPASTPAAPSNVPMQPKEADIRPPGQNLTDQNIVSVEPVSSEKLDSNGNVISSTQPVNEVDRWTNALMNLPSYAPPNMRDAIKARLQSAINLNTPDASVHFMKNDDGSETPVVITKQGGKVTITDTKGNPYVSPTAEGTNSSEIANAIMEGKQPPSTTGLYRQGAAVRAQLAKKGFDMTNAELEWKAAQKQVQSLNGPQMTRYAGLAKSVVNTIDEVKSLSEQMANSGIPALNAAKIQAYIQTAGNSEKGQLAARYLASVNTLKEEFANLAQGGYAPTEAAWALANQQINGNYGVQQLSASLNEVQRLIRYRLQGIPNFQSLGPDAANRYTKGAGEAPSTQQPSHGVIDWESYFGAVK